MHPLHAMVTQVVYHDFDAWKSATQAAGLRVWTYADVESPEGLTKWDMYYAITTTCGNDPDTSDLRGLWICENRVTDELESRWIGKLFANSREYHDWCREFDAKQG